MITNIILFLSRLGSLGLGGYTGNEIYTLILFSLSGIFVYGGYSLWILQAAGLSIKDWWMTICGSTASSAIILFLSWALCLSFNLPSWSLLAVYGSISILYYNNFIITKSKFNHEIN